MKGTDTKSGMVVSMKTTYFRTMMIEDITKATFKLYITEGCKYLAKSSEDGNTATFRNSHVDMFIR